MEMVHLFLAATENGSSKTGCSCSTFIIESIDAATGEVRADYSLQHTGQKQEIAYSRFSADIHSRIAGRLAQGVSMNSVLDFITDTQAGPLSRDHLVTHKDLNNIKHQYNTDCIQKFKRIATMPPVLPTGRKKWSTRITIQFCITSLRWSNQMKRELRKMIFYW